MRAGLLFFAATMLLACGEEGVLEARLPAPDGPSTVVWAVDDVGQDPLIRIQVPEPGLVGLGLYVRATEVDGLSVDALAMPGGELLVHEGRRVSDERRVAGMGDVWMTVPFDGGRGTLAAGAWELSMLGSVDRLEIWYRSAESAPVEGIDLVVFADFERYAPLVFEDVLHRAGELLGLSVSSITWRDTRGSREPLGPEELADALAEYGDALEPTISLVLTEAVEVSASADALGFVGAIPGYPAGGSARSGIAVSPLGDPELDARIIAHELGHFFGLHHTTDSSGRDDGLADTPTCGDSIDVDPDRCPDRDNLMFSTLGRTDLTPAQRRIIAASISHGGLPADPSERGGPSDHGRILGERVGDGASHARLTCRRTAVSQAEAGEP